MVLYFFQERLAPVVPLDQEEKPAHKVHLDRPASLDPGGKQELQAMPGSREKMGSKGTEALQGELDLREKEEKQELQAHLEVMGRQGAKGPEVG